ncbi:MAG: GNAT family N-acetyltransferase [Anaerolineae bacterium]|nr:GNAT family N-acetyltransferase [Anaerolineae bacterium]
MSRVPCSPLESALTCVDVFYERLFRNWPDAVTRAGDTYTLSYSGAVHLSGANHLWPRTPDALTLPALADALAFFRPYQAVWSVIYTDTYMPQAAAQLQALGFGIRWSSPLMVLSGLPRPAGYRPNARVSRVTSVQQINHLRTIVTEAFHTDDSVNQRVARPEHVTTNGVRHYLIYAGREPAACATVAPGSNGMAGIWNVGTCQRFRRQRYATTLMLHILDDLAAEGVTDSMLMASPSGQPLYEQLGYRTVGTTYYMRPPHHPYGPFT